MNDKINEKALLLVTHPYIVITDAEIEPGKPGSSQLMTKMRDNPEAIAAGSGGAPRVQDGAFDLNTINANKLLDDTLDFVTKPSRVSIPLSQNVSAGISFIFPRGIFNIALGENFIIEVLVTSNQWQAIASNEAANVVCDGISVRARNTAGTNQTLLYYQLY